MVSSSHAICVKGLYVAIVSGTAETSSDHEEELQPGVDLLGEIEESFFYAEDFYIPTSDGSESRLFITESYDPTSHFESASDDVLRIYESIMGEPLDLTVLPEPTDE